MSNREQINKLKERLDISIQFSIDHNENLNVSSWNYQEGILLTPNEAKLFSDYLSIRQKINFDLLELLERYEAMKSLLEEITSNDTPKDYGIAYFTYFNKCAELLNKYNNE